MVTAIWNAVNAATVGEDFHARSSYGLLAPWIGRYLEIRSYHGKNISFDYLCRYRYKKYTTMPSYLSYSATAILQAVANGYQYGFDIMDVTGLPSGTVYPALRRLEDGGLVISKWEKHQIAQKELRPPRKYYELT